MIAVDKAAGKRIAMDAIEVGPITKGTATIPIHILAVFATNRSL